MNSCLDIDDRLASVELPPILLSGDNARTVVPLHHSLLGQGLHVQFVPYFELEAAWKKHRYPVVLLEVSGAHAVEAAINAALELKRHDPHQFVGYLADPAPYSRGLTGDAIFPRTSDKLVPALRSHLLGGF
ncbi:MAG TPA: hypothetical protein VME86_05180 [Acidobacteriaceae bacterium]|nr:hypothetical protein [Acidobacteriaceae bacterium]